MVVAHAHLGAVEVVALVHGGLLEAVVVPRQHVDYEDLGPPVAGEVGHVGAHRGEADAGHGLFERLGERAVAVAEVEVVALEKVVAHVQVEPSVAVHVAERDAEPERDLGAVDAGPRAPVDKAGFGRRALVEIELVAALVVALVPDVAKAERAHGPERVVEHVHVEVAVLVGVEKGAVRRRALVGEAPRRGLVGKAGDAVGAIAPVDEELVGAVVAVHVAGVAHVEVEPAVGVHVGDGDAGAPRASPGHARELCHVLEADRPAGLGAVQEELVRSEVGGEVEIGPAVPVHVAYADPAAVEEVAVGEDVEGLRLFERVGEIEPGLACGQRGEQRLAVLQVFGRAVTAAPRQHQHRGQRRYLNQRGKPSRHRDQSGKKEDTEPVRTRTRREG